MSEELIRRPEADPFVLGLANLCLLGGGGYYWLGQRRKAWITWAVVLIGGCCTLGTTWVLVFATAYDAYLLGQRLQLGEGVEEGQTALPVLRLLFR